MNYKIKILTLICSLLLPFNFVKAITPYYSASSEYLVSSGASDNTWIDVDVTSYLGDDAGNVAGIIVDIPNTSGTEFLYGIRNNGSTDSFVGIAEDTSHTIIGIGIDSNDIFEIYLDDATYQYKVRLLGYVLNEEGTFLTNSSELTLSATTAWTDIDITSITTGDDVATFAFMLVENDNASANTYDYGVRKNGSTDNTNNYVNNIYGGGEGDIEGAMIGVDENEVFEAYQEHTDIDFYLTGWLTDNVTTFANGIDNDSESDAQYDKEIDWSASIADGNTGAMYEYRSQSEYYFAIRSSASEYSNLGDITYIQTGYTNIATSTRTVIRNEEIYTNTDVFLLGYTNIHSGAVASDTCTYDTGDWEVLYSDNCLITEDPSVDGDIYLQYDDAGSFASIADISLTGDIIADPGFTVEFGQGVGFKVK